MIKTLIVIDSFISNLERAFSCERLTKQIRSVFGPDYKILLINKSGNDYRLQDKVDYYINIEKSPTIGLPPNEIIDNSSYERPYIYVSTDVGTCENWLPLTGITDHVGGIYNSFVLSTRLAKSLNFEKIFKIEYDTNFDIDELKDIKMEIDSNHDILFYGKRKNGDYAKENHYLIDTHIIGYDNTLFDGFDLIKTEKDFWDLCKKINYYGKWIEYIVPSIFEYQKKQEKNFYDVIIYEGNLREKYSKTKFDIINGEGGWTEKWKSIPKVCEFKNDSSSNLRFGLFYWNDEESLLEINVKIIDDTENIIYTKNINLNKNHYFFDTIDLNEKKLTIYKTNVRQNKVEEFVEKIDVDTIKNFNTKFKFNN